MKIVMYMFSFIVYIVLLWLIAKGIVYVTDFDFRDAVLIIVVLELASSAGIRGVKAYVNEVSWR